MDDTSYHIMYFQSSDGQVLWSLHHLFQLLSLFSIIRGLALPWMLHLWSSCQTFCGNTSSRWILTSVVTFAAVLLQFTDTILLADDVLPWYVYVTITLEIAALDTPNKVTVLLQMLLLNTHQQSALFENLRRLPFCSTYRQTVTEHNL